MRRAREFLVVVGLGLCWAAAAKAAPVARSSKISLAKLHQHKFELEQAHDDMCEQFYIATTLKSGKEPLGLRVAKSKLNEATEEAWSRYHQTQKAIDFLWKELVSPLQPNVDADEGKSRGDTGALRQMRVKDQLYFDDPKLSIPKDDPTDLSVMMDMEMFGVDQPTTLTFPVRAPGSSKGVHMTLVRPSVMAKERYDRRLGRGYQSITSLGPTPSHGLGWIPVPKELDREEKAMYLVDLRTAGEDGAFGDIAVLPASDANILKLSVRRLGHTDWQDLVVPLQ